MGFFKALLFAVVVGTAFVTLDAQQPQASSAHTHSAAVPLQPLAQHVRTIASALAYIGQPLSADDLRRIDEALGERDEQVAVARLQEILDRQALVVVDINPESRVKVSRGPTPAELVEGGTRMFLVKVINQAGVRAPLVVESPNSGPVYRRARR